MRPEHLAYLVCPACRNTLLLRDGAMREEHVDSGRLYCATCNRHYPITNAIPRFVSLDNYASGFGFQWNKHYLTQYDSFTGLPLSETRFFSETQWPRNLTGEIILEAGCGSGRFTPHAADTGAMVISFDYSSAVEACYAQNGHRPNVLVIQADIFRPPFPDKMFDKIFCFGVLQHTPNPREAFLALPPLLKPGGEIVIDVYKRNRISKFISFTPAPPTKYYVRPFTVKLPPATLYFWIERYIGAVWPLSQVIRRIPVVGRNINWMILIADHSNLDLRESVQKQWAILNTFDMLSPRYDIPQHITEVKRWLDMTPLITKQVKYGYNGIVAKGVAPPQKEP